MLGTETLPETPPAGPGGLRWWIAGIALSAVLLLGLGAALVQTRARAVDAFNRDAMATHAAGQDLHVGVLNLWLAARQDDEVGPWDRGVGLAKLAQAERDLTALAARIDANVDVGDVREHFSVLRQGVDGQTAPNVQMRLALDALGEAHRRLDAALEDRLHTTRQRLDLFTGALLLGSVLVIAGTTAGALRADRRSSTARDRLRRNERQYRSTLAAMAEAVVTFDAQGRLLVANPAAEAQLGLSLAPWLGEVPAPDWTLCDDQGQPLAREDRPLWQALEQGRSVRDCVVGTTLAGQAQRWLSINAEPLRDEEGSAVVGAVLSFVDVTEERQRLAELTAHRERLEDLVRQRTAALASALQAREAAEAFLRMVADTMPDRVAYWDAERRCRFANQAACLHLGRPLDDVLGRTIDELLGAELMPDRAERLDAAYGGEAQTFERDETLPDGRAVTMQVRYVPDLADSQVRGLLVLATDVTLLQQTSAQLAAANAALARRADDAESATRAKSAFLANMSHEIRTPMNAIIGLTHLMARDSRDPLQRDRLRKVDGAAHHLLQVINDILDLSKVEAGKWVLHPAPFERDALIRRAIDVVAPQAEAKGLELIVETDHLPARLVGDTKALAQCLINMLGNAVKFTERGWVRLRAERLGQDEAGVQVRFTVCDTGPGVAADQLPQLFEAFAQGDDSLTRRHGGTGLGLALTRHLARAMGGEAGAESEPGQGSRFWFTATLGPAPDEVPGDAPVPLPLQGRRVLVVDDLDTARHALQEQLEGLGLQVLACSSGTEALQLVELAVEAGRPFDVLVLDWQMPGLDGVATLAALRARLGQALAPALLVSAHDDDAMWQASAAAGFCAVLLKPVLPAALADALEEALRSPQPVAAPVPVPQPGDAERQLRALRPPRTVLLAEDNPVNQEVAKALLEEAGLRVVIADDGTQAVQHALAGGVDLVLMDMQMPGMDGLAATRAIRTRLGPGLPIIAMTANAFDEDRQACTEAGMDDHLAKPVNPERLYQLLLQRLAPRAGVPATAARVPATDDALAALERIEGLDVATALRNLGGQTAWVVRILRRFADQYRDGALALRAPADAMHRPTLAAACHSLRGACASIGTLPLAAEIAALERAVDNLAVGDAALHAAAGAVDDGLRHLAADIDAALGA